MYLVVTAGMLVYLGRYEARLRSGIERLARWPVPAGKSTERALSESLEHASGILSARRALVVWEAAEEPGVQIASWSASGLTLARQSPDDVLPLLPSDLQDKIILSPGSIDAEANILVNEPNDRLAERKGLPLSPAILRSVAW